MQLKPDIDVEMSTSGRCAARLLGDMGFSVDMADPASLALFFNACRKNDKLGGSYRIAKPLRLNGLQEAYFPSKGAESTRALVGYRKPLWGRYNRAQEHDTCNSFSTWNTYTCDRYIWEGRIVGNCICIFKAER